MRFLSCAAADAFGSTDRGGSPMCDSRCDTAPEGAEAGGGSGLARTLWLRAVEAEPRSRDWPWWVRSHNSDVG